MLLHISSDWLDEDVATRGGGRKQRRALLKLGSGVGKDTELRVPVRWLQVLYAIPGDLYKRRTGSDVPGPHEYFCRHSSLKGYNAQSLQAMLASMTIRSHYLTEPGR